MTLPIDELKTKKIVAKGIQSDLIGRRVNCCGEHIEYVIVGLYVSGTQLYAVVANEKGVMIPLPIWEVVLVGPKDWWPDKSPKG